MKSVLLALALGAMPVVGAAECLKADSLAKGVSFSRADGRKGFAAMEGAELFIDYAVGSKTAWFDQRRAQLGIYETEWNSVPTDAYFVGGGPGGRFTYRFSGNPPVPAAGKTWSTKVYEKRSQEVGLESGPEVSRATYAVTYRFLPPVRADFSGCTYVAQPVEARFKAGTTDLTRRWIYFPELGFGLETRLTDNMTGEVRNLGLTAMAPKE